MVSKKKTYKTVRGLNYALGGATSDAGTSQGYTGPSGTWPTAGAKQQLEMYSTGQLKRKTDKVYAIFTGANDVFFGLMAGKPVTTEGFLQPIVATIGGMVESIIQMESSSSSSGGGRRVKVIVSNMYNLDTIPFLLTIPSSAYAGATQTFNSLLENELERLKTSNGTSGLDIKLFDLTTSIKDIVHEFEVKGRAWNATCVEGDYYAGNVKVCKNPGQFIYYDQFHPTSWVHRVLATQLGKLSGLL